MTDSRLVVLVSADYEWQAVKEIISPPDVQKTPLGETFHASSLTYFHGGWGKISAAATTQYVIDHFQPTLLVNLGTCGGFKDRIDRGDIILVTETVAYDILEQMSDPQEAIAHYNVKLDLSWLRTDFPPPVKPGLIVSADRDILPADIPFLIKRYNAVAADWESAAIAWVAQRNGIKCLILRGISDLVSNKGGEAYGNIDLFRKNTWIIMKSLVEQFPTWYNSIKLILET
jgi:adenosylhomocysteine nucleosidase